MNKLIGLLAIGLILLACNDKLDNKNCSRCNIIISPEIKDNQICSISEKMPVLQSDTKSIDIFLMEKLNYPINQKKQQTKVKLSFVVNSNGQVTRAKIIGKSVSNYSLLEKECINIIGLPV